MVEPQSSPDSPRTGVEFVETFLTNDADIDQASRSLKAMAHPLRLKILCILCRTGEIGVQELVDRVGTSQSNISQHLSILRDKGILECRKEANKVYYRIRDPNIFKLMTSLRSAFCERP
ncbi:MAG TPA: metalloregulator ArsR/SmtB family transcription factor [Arenicellales bacterium]|nr:metalloregulator ArsR/SmtB family transcription factor [Arenicellales bacterium]